MFYACFRTPIVKAEKRKRNASATYRRVDALSRQMGNAFAVDLSKGMKRFKKHIDPEELYQAWLKGNYEGLSKVVPWNDLESELEHPYARAEQAMKGSWDASKASMPAPQDPRLRFDTKNPGVREFISTRKADTFKNLSEDSAKNIRNWTLASFDRALTPRQVADGIKDQIGLLPQHAQAVRRYAQGLYSVGHSHQNVQAMSAKYADQLLDYRAMMIARTETRMAANQGQLAVWKAAADQGLIDGNTAQKVWVVDGNPCDICDPMDGKAVGLDDEWQLNNGDAVDVPSESHPHCYCGMEIEYAGAENDRE